METFRCQSLPDITSLKRLCQSLAMLDAILQPEWEGRYYSFNSRWAEGQMMASMRNGSGDGYFILFDDAGAIIKGYAHESHFAGFYVENGHAWPGVVDRVPKEFAGFMSEPAFSTQEATFCFWRTHSDGTWQAGNIRYPVGNDPDGAINLLSILDGNPQTYQAWAKEYYEKKVPLEVTEKLYQYQPLTENLVAGLNRRRSIKGLGNDIAEIGYPSEL